MQWIGLLEREPEGPAGYGLLVLADLPEESSSKLNFEIDRAFAKQRLFLKPKHSPRAASAALDAEPNKLE